jgi:hypothetical protein
MARVLTIVNNTAAPSTGDSERGLHKRTQRLKKEPLLRPTMSDELRPSPFSSPASGGLAARGQAQLGRRYVGRLQAASLLQGPRFPTSRKGTRVLFRHLTPPTLRVTTRHAAGAQEKRGLFGHVLQHLRPYVSGHDLRRKPRDRDRLRGRWLPAAAAAYQ